MSLGLVLFLTFCAAFTLYFFGLNYLLMNANPLFKRMRDVQFGMATKTTEAAIGTEGKKWPANWDVQKILEQLGKVAKDSVKHESQIKADLVAAGYIGESAYLKFMGIKVAAAVGGFLFFNFIGAFSDRPVRIVMLMSAASALSLFLLPDIILRFKVDHRQQEIAAGLPDALDLMVICVEAGLGLNAAIQRVGQDMAIRNISLSTELLRVAQDLRMGNSREKALRALADRNRVEDLKILVGALVLADRLGTSIASTLRAQSDALRTRIRQKAEENAAKAGIKMLLPLTLFILPALFIVLIGPAVLMIIDTFGK